MKLTGTVLLDEQTMNNLKEEIRKEVLEDIKSDGNYEGEIIQFLEDCDYSGYLYMIHTTINHILNKTNEQEITFASDKVRYKKLLAIKAILDI